MRHILQHSTPQQLLSYAVCNEPASAMVVWDDVGSKLVSGECALALLRPSGEPLVVITDRKWIITGNDDRFQQAIVSNRRSSRATASRDHIREWPLL